MKVFGNILLCLSVISISFGVTKFASANPKCYVGGGLGTLSQTLYGPQYDEENNIVEGRIKFATVDDTVAQAFVGCSVNDSADIEINTFISKGSVYANPTTKKDTTITQRAIIIDGVFKAPAFENGLELYGKLGYGFFLQRAAEKRLTGVVDVNQTSLKPHAALGVSYLITDNIKVRAEYHRFPSKGLYVAKPITINLSYQFD